MSFIFLSVLLVMKERSMERYQTPLKIEMSLVITFAVSVVEKRTRPNKEETSMQNVFYMYVVVKFYNWFKCYFSLF